MPDATKLPAVALTVIHAMLYGVDQTMFPGSKDIPPGTPLTLKHAAIACGVRVRRMEKIADTKQFQDALRCEIAARRESEDPRNLAVAISIRDDKGDGSPKVNRLRLKAIDTIRGKEPVHAVQVDVSNRTTVANVTPGYVSKLDDPQNTVTIDLAPAGQGRRGG